MNLSKKRFIRIALAVIVAGLLALADACWVEPNWIQVTRHTVPAAIGQRLIVAHLTDLHTSALGFREKRLLQFLEEARPDVIVITGDTLSPWGDYNDVCNLLSQLRAPLGVWLVRGNWENWLRRIPGSEAQYYRRCGVSFLLNQSAEVRPGVWLVGLDDPTFGRADLEGAMKAVPGDAYRIALFHSPAFFAVSAGRYELALAGHSHGGQVRLPFLEPLWLPSGIGRFVEGWFEKDGSRMYVSRGIGMTILPIRFFCRPELAIITLEPQGK